MSAWRCCAWPRARSSGRRRKRPSLWSSWDGPSNVILIDETGNIVDCMRRADFGEGAYRRLLPGMLYRLPQRPEKPAFSRPGPEERRTLWANSGGAEPERWADGTPSTASRR